MKKITFVALAALTITACSSGPEFEVNGDVSGADGKMLYLEASGLEGIVPLDSVKLKGEGTFKFKQPRPESPEFYRLRVDDKVINFSVDSIETIQIKAPYVDFSTAYTVEGSDNSNKIKELTLKQINLQKNVNDQLNALRANKLGHDTFEENLATLLKNYKEDVKVNYIFAAPNTSAAYFALFQKLNDYLIFDPLNNKEDVKCFAAVATSLNNAYPNAVRSKNLYNIVIKGMKNTRQPQSKSLEIPQDKIIETGIIDIALRDVKGNTRKLTDLKGKVVLLDFSVFQSPAGAPHNMMLRELYNKYASQGLEIYQVSLDADEHYWKTAAGNLPWVCVRDGNGVYSTNVAVYNVRQVPSIFLINRNNELLLKLVNDVVEISRLDSGSMDLEIKEWDMRTIVKEIYMAYQALIKPSLQFHLALDENPSLPVNIDRMRFIQVISNFLGNADKFTRSGSITLGCKVDKKGRKVSVYVQDTGKGIDEKELMMIFDRFYKTDEFEQGSGLGLSICKVIIEKLCGHIEVQSEVGKGSCFTVVLSLADEV